MNFRGDLTDNSAEKEALIMFRLTLPLCPLHCPQYCLYPKLCNFFWSHRKYAFLWTLIFVIRIHTFRDGLTLASAKTKSLIVQLCEPIDNSLRALLKRSNDKREIAIFAVNETLPQGGQFQFVIVYDNGCGMSRDTFAQWMHRGLPPRAQEAVRFFQNQRFRIPNITSCCRVIRNVA